MAVSSPRMDEWKEVMNGPDTYEAIADKLRNDHSVVIGWTDGRHSHHDILFCLFPHQFGNLQGGLRGTSHVFVSVMRMGAFGFQITDDEIHVSYIREKLNLGEGFTSEALAELLTGVIRALHTKP